MTYLFTLNKMINALMQERCSVDCESKTTWKSCFILFFVTPCMSMVFTQNKMNIDEYLCVGNTA